MARTFPTSSSKRALCARRVPAVSAELLRSACACLGGFGRAYAFGLCLSLRFLPSLCGGYSALTRRGPGGFHMRVNCWPAKRCVWPVLAPAQACVRARERRGQFGIRNRGAGNERVRPSVSVVAICPRFMPDVAILSRRFALGAHPALRFWRGGLPLARTRRCDSVAAV